MSTYTPEATLEIMVRDLVAGVKRRYPCWSDPQALCQALGIDLQQGYLGQGREGAALADAIVLDPTAGVPARRRFTLYHEIVHHLIRRNDVLYAALDEQYRLERDLTNILERLCDVGAAEFVLPAAVVRAATAAHGWTVALIDELASGGASRVAACVQLALLAPHRCVAVVGRLRSIEHGNDHSRN